MSSPNSNCCKNQFQSYAEMVSFNYWNTAFWFPKGPIQQLDKALILSRFKMVRYNFASLVISLNINTKA